MYKKKAMEMNLIGQVLDDHLEEMINSMGRTYNSFLLKLYNTCHFFKVGPLWDLFNVYR